VAIKNGIILFYLGTWVMA